MTTTRQATAPVSFDRVSPGIYAGGGHIIRREATTSGPKRAANPMWNVYQDGVARRVARYRTLAQAQAYVTRNPA